MQDLRRPLPRPQHRAGVEFRRRDEPQLHVRDDRRAARAAAQRPEQLRVVVGVDVQLLAVAGDDVEGQHRVTAHAEGARQPADATAERVADEADVGRGARQCGEAELGGRRRQIGAERAGLDAGRALLEVDLDPAHQARAEQDRLVDASAGGGVVAGALGRDAQPLLAGEAHDGGDVVSRSRLGDEDGALVDGQVPRHTGFVVAGFAGSVQVAGELRAEGVQRGDGTSGGDQGESFGETGWGTDADPGLPRRPSHQGSPWSTPGVRTTAPGSI